VSSSTAPDVAVTPFRPALTAGVRASLGRIATIAALTVREASRRRLLLALIAMTLLAIAFTAWGFLQLRRFRDGGAEIDGSAIQLVASQLLILVMFMYSFVVALTAVFVAAPAIAGEIESGQALALVARPLARWELLIGRWVGLTALVSAYAVGTSLVQIGATWATTHYLPPSPVAAALGLAGQAVVILTLSLVLSTRLSSVTGGIVGLLVFGIGWVSGIVAGIGHAFGDALVENVGTAIALLVPTDGLWRASMNALEPPAIRAAVAGAGPTAAAFPFFAPFPPTVEYLLYVVGWIVVLLALGAVSLQRRDI
jgi:ABC-type transport system involved in multi-copper enzyme maturation permease subunit